MATKKPSPAMEFVVAALKKNPKVEYASLKESAAKKGLTIFPIVYGRAKALLGLVPVAPRGSKKKKAIPKKTATRAVTGAKRPATRASGSVTLDSLQNLVADMKQVTADRDRYQRALEEMAKILDRAL